MSVVYHYRRYYAPYEEVIASLTLALMRAEHDVTYNLAAPEKIVLEDGTELGREEILGRSGYYATFEDSCDG